MDLSRYVFKLDLRVVDGAVNGAAWLTRRLSNWTGLFDFRVVDGAVNGAGLGTSLLARGLRRVQTGQAQWYAAALFVGVVGLAVLVTRFVGG
jgi:NADH-quinone oxidoreductase subunit L